MAFAFNFDVDDGGVTAAAAVDSQFLSLPSSSSSTAAPAVPLLRWRAISPSPLTRLASATPFPNAPPKLGLLHVPVADADSVSGVRGTDVVAGVYEGGAKVWECTLDVLKYMARSGVAAQLAGASVLDLGCGTGMLGSAALRVGAASVAFSDLNAAVLRDITSANACANGGGAGNVRFFAGDWSALLAAALAEEGGGGRD